MRLRPACLLQLPTSDPTSRPVPLPRRPWFAAVLLALLTAAQSPTAAAPFEDSIAQRVLACTGCHGPEGRAASDGYYPRIAGKPAGYLYNQLLNFRDGRRVYGPMTLLIGNLTDDYLKEMAQYFSQLDLPWPAPQAITLTPQQQADGRQLALHGDAARKLPACADCHGAALTGLAPHVPGLLGLPRDYLNAQLGAWRIGQRHARDPDCMAEIARQLRPEEVAAVTGWIATQPVGKHPAAPVAAADRPWPRPCGELEGGSR